MLSKHITIQPHTTVPRVMLLSEAALALNPRSTTANCLTLNSLPSLSEHLGFALPNGAAQNAAFVALVQ